MMLASWRLLQRASEAAFIPALRAAADNLTTDLQKAKTLPLITLMTLIFTDEKQTDVYLVPLKSLNSLGTIYFHS
jgi:hypothetical protein